MDVQWYSAHVKCKKKVQNHWCLPTEGRKAAREKRKCISRACLKMLVCIWLFIFCAHGTVQHVNRSFETQYCFRRSLKIFLFLSTKKPFRAGFSRFSAFLKKNFLACLSSYLEAAESGAQGNLMDMIGTSPPPAEPAMFTEIE